MASINDLATAATIASSVVALRSEELPTSTATTTAGAAGAGDSTAAVGNTRDIPAEASTTNEMSQTQKTAADREDGDSITVATGAPPPVLAAPVIDPDPARAQIPLPPPVEGLSEVGSTADDGEAGGVEGVGGEEEGDRDGDAMDGVERGDPVRGAFVVFEGMDRAGKTTQAKLLQQRCVESGREVRFMRFPDRTTPIGLMIDSYLKGETEVEDHVIHLLFSANRWEAVKKIKAELEAGHTIICDRFYHSGIVYSAAKNIKSLSLSWAKAPEVGLPRPDIVLFLDLDEEVARERGGWGGEVYEKGEMQRRVRDLFWGLSMGDLGSAVGNSGTSTKVPRRGDVERLGNGSGRGGDSATNEEGEFRQEEEDIQIVDADLDVESLSEKVWEHVLPRLESVERGEVGRTVRTVR
ncbi:thymidylate kinase-domain-containing protein [Annulohypoxylon maeteangense]|uniref:thymidylate kinase-domain-containing protein n=1 Tax=Annulohypoxylon maeteangense TaxID=1927788 RepID=UPI0020087E61|nr:thymidylate kinase-domain-containing protein [Annulohypoxylon maeteangense]KAI0884305.1 thymidylate kinase-domain-containing protein [Annulohypoxylon maeteangense]